MPDNRFTNPSGGGTRETGDPQSPNPQQTGTNEAIPQGYNHQLIQQALGYSDRAVQQQEAANMQALGAVESSMFDQLGRQQLQTEREIGERRTKALRQGMPSSQLAAMELQNVQTSQLGAQQVAREYDQMRHELATETAGMADMQRFGMAESLIQGRTDAQAIDAQRYAHDMGAQLEGLVGEEVWSDLSSDQRLAMLTLSMGGELTSEQEDSLRKEGLLPEQEPGFWEEHGTAMATGGGTGGLVGGTIAGSTLAGAKKGAFLGPKGIVIGGAIGAGVGYTYSKLSGDDDSEDDSKDD